MRLFVKAYKRKKKIVVTLTKHDVRALRKMVKSGMHKARALTRARILLLSHEGKTNSAIVEALGCSPRSVTDIRERYVKRERSISRTITDAPRSGQPKKILPKHIAYVIATACSSAPEGHNHWTLEALRDKLLVTYSDLESVSHEWIRQILIRAALKPWREKNVVHSETHARVSRTHG